MPRWMPAMKLAAVTADAINGAVAGGVRLVILKRGPEIVAYEDACPHEGHPLSDGELDADVLICTRHLWEFEVLTGKHVSRLDNPSNNLNRFPTRIVGDLVEVDLDAPSRPGVALPRRNLLD